MKLNVYKPGILIGLMLVLLLAACQSSPQPAAAEAAFKLGCESAGGIYQSSAAYGGGQNEVCQFPDGLTCGPREFASGACPPVGPTSGALTLDQTPTPYPTKEQAIPATPIVKGADPFPGWATYLNAQADFAFRYPDAWLVEEGPNLARLSRSGMELLVRYHTSDEPAALSADLPYQGEQVPGPGAFFFGAPVPETQQLVDDRIVAVTFGTPDQPLTGGGNAYLVQLVSLQSDTALPENTLVELRTMLSSFEAWTNNDQ